MPLSLVRSSQLQQILASKSGDSEEVQQSAQAALDRAALRTLLVHRRHGAARSASSDLFNTPDFAEFRYNLDRAVKDGKLAVRVDRDMYADLGLRGQILSLLMSYQTEWLRLGLETVYGEEVVSTFAPATPKEAQNDDGLDDEEKKAAAAKRRHATAVVKQKQARGKPPMTRTQAALKRFIVERVLGDPSILATYTQGRKCKVPSGKFGKMYKDELRKASLNRVLLLVSFLDKGRMNNVLARAPCLFRAGNTEVKSTKEVRVRDANANTTYTYTAF